MKAKHRISLPLFSSLMCAALVGCGGGGQAQAINDAMPKKAKSLAELAEASKKELSPEQKAEQEKLRQELGIKTEAEKEAEKKAIAADFEKGAREYIKTRIKDYNALLADMRSTVDGIEKGAAKWAKDGKTFAKSFAALEEQHRAIDARFMELTKNGAEGGNTQAEFGKAFRTAGALLEEIKQNGPSVVAGDALAAKIAPLREGYDAVEKRLGEIAADESLVVNKFHKDEAGKGDEKQG